MDTTIAPLPEVARYWGVLPGCSTRDGDTRIDSAKRIANYHPGTRLEYYLADPEIRNEDIGC